jgi:hypothetical protein
MSIHTLRRELWIPRPRPEVFEFFSQASNLERITPPWLNFHVQTPDPIEMRPGTLIDYKLKIHGLPVEWRTEIRTWDPPLSFSDVQLKGPYKTWNHTHTFLAENGGTRMRDEVVYELPFGILGDLVRLLKVRSDVEQVFDYRNQQIAKFFQGSK